MGTLPRSMKSRGDRRGTEKERNSISIFGTAIKDRGVCADISGEGSRFQNFFHINLTLVIQRHIYIPASVMPDWFCLCQPLFYLPLAACTFKASPVILIPASDRVHISFSNDATWSNISWMASINQTRVILKRAKDSRDILLYMPFQFALFVNNISG
jgi:hypothetical protein